MANPANATTKAAETATTPARQLELARTELTPPVSGLLAVPSGGTQELATLLADADRGSRSAVLRQVQRSHGNAAVQRLVHESSRRFPAAQRAVPILGGPIVQRELSADDANRVANAKQLIEKAAKNKGAAQKPLKSYAESAPGALTDLKTTFDESLKAYERAKEIVNRKVEKAKAEAAVRDKLLMTIVDAASGPLIGEMNKALDSMGLNSEELGKGYKELSEQLGGAFPGVADAAKGEVKKAAGMGAGEASSKGVGGAPAWASELGFYKSYSSLLEKGMGLLPLANGIAEVSGPIAKIEQGIADINIAKKALSYPIKDLEHDAAALESGTRSIAAAAPGVAGLVSELKTMVQVTKAAAPQSDSEVEKELWIQWAAQLDPGDFELLDETPIQSYLESIGIWSQLGIDQYYLSDKEQSVASISAAAQAKVLEHKGESVEMHVAAGKALGDVSLSGLPDLPASMGDSTVGMAYDQDVGVKAVVVGATTNRTLDESVLQLAENNRPALADAVLRQRWITVILRDYETVYDTKEAGQGEPTAEPEPAAAE